VTLGVPAQAIGEERRMTRPHGVLRGRLLAALTAGAVLLGPASAFAQGAAANPMDRSNPEASNQDTGLRGHPTPPTITPTEKIPVGRLKLPARSGTTAGGGR
jgi:hypothetical protein